MGDGVAFHQVNHDLLHADPRLKGVFACLQISRVLIKANAEIEDEFVDPVIGNHVLRRQPIGDTGKSGAGGDDDRPFLCQRPLRLEFLLAEVKRNAQADDAHDGKGDHHIDQNDDGIAHMARARRRGRSRLRLNRITRALRLDCHRGRTS